MASPEGKGRASKPVAPVRVAQVMPAVTSAQETAGAKGRGKGLWVGVGVVALVLIGGATALVLPSKDPAPTTPSAVQGASSSTSSGAPSPATARPAEPLAAPPTGTAAPSEVKVAVPTPPDAGPAPTEVADAGVVAQAAPVEAKGTLVVVARPYATVLVTGQKPREVQGTSRYSLPPGTYKVTFQPPSGASKTFDVSITPNGSVTKSFDARKR